MKAFHTFRVHKTKKTILNDFEIFTMTLSALEWKKLNGTICIITDTAGMEYLCDLGLLNALSTGFSESIWDEYSLELDSMDALNIDENVFWAGCKLYALQQFQEPCVMMDLDFIVWETLDFSQYGNQITVIHREDVNNPIYPNKDYFSFHDDYTFDPDLDWNEEACNTAFAYFGDVDFMHKYAQKALEFMQHADVHINALPYMVTAEQRLLSMYAKIYGKHIYSFSTIDELVSSNQKKFTHIWGDKVALSRNEIMNTKFCSDCAKRIIHDFPEWAELLKKEDWFKKYCR